jgi:HEAT repeat protein
MDAGRIHGAKAFELRVEAQQGLIASGTAAIPFALRMLASSDAEIREDAGGVLAALGRREDVVPQVLAALEDERDEQARDALVVALGELRDRRAIPASRRAPCAVRQSR